MPTTRLTPEQAAAIEALCARRAQEILHTSDTISVQGKTYYVSADGCDENDGLSAQTPWKTLQRVSDAALSPGDGVCFRRGDTFRGFVRTKPGVTYFAYGQGDKPKFYGWNKNLADPALWTLVDAEHHIWQHTELILDCGTLVFDGGEQHSRKLIPSYLNGEFVCRDDESRLFIMSEEMTRDLDIFCRYDARMTTEPSKGQTFPVPKIDAESFGTLFLRCDRGNPGEVFSDIEALTGRHMFYIGENDNVTIDNLCIKFIGTHAIAGGSLCLKGLHVTNCEIAWVGGAIQHYLGTDPNYPQGGRGTVTRYGNGVEIYGGCDDYLVENCLIDQVYDAGITHQITTRGQTYTLTNIRYLNNLITRCVYSIEYFLEKTEGDTASYMGDIVMSGNILRLSGYGWGQQRHNTDTPAHIKGWSYENTARNVLIEDNLFDRAAYRMLHLVCRDEDSLPILKNNRYIQHSGQMLGQYGANATAEPPILPFDENAETTLRDVLHEEGASVHIL